MIHSFIQGGARWVTGLSCRFLPSLIRSVDGAPVMCRHCPGCRDHGGRGQDSQGFCLPGLQGRAKVMTGRLGTVPGNAGFERKGAQTGQGLPRGLSFMLTAEPRLPLPTSCWWSRAVTLWTEARPHPGNVRVEAEGRLATLALSAGVTPGPVAASGRLQASLPPPARPQPVQSLPSLLPSLPSHLNKFAYIVSDEP